MDFFQNSGKQYRMNSGVYSRDGKVVLLLAALLKSRQMRVHEYENKSSTKWTVNSVYTVYRLN